MSNRWSALATYDTRSSRAIGAVLAGMTIFARKLDQLDEWWNGDREPEQPHFSPPQMTEFLVRSDIDTNRIRLVDPKMADRVDAEREDAELACRERHPSGLGPHEVYRRDDILYYEPKAWHESDGPAA